MVYVEIKKRGDLNGLLLLAHEVGKIIFRQSRIREVIEVAILLKDDDVDFPQKDALNPLSFFQKYKLKKPH